MSQEENPQAKDGQTFNEGTEPGWAGSWQPEDKIDTSGFKEGDQFGAFTLHLKKTSIKKQEINRIIRSINGINFITELASSL